MQNIDYICTFKNAMLEADPENMHLFGLINGRIQEVAQNEWRGDFKNTLENHGGALVIVQKHEHSDELNRILDTYDGWAISNVHKDLNLKPTTFKWVNYVRNGNKLEKSYSFNMITKGQLLVLSGKFPDLQVNLSTAFGRVAVESNPKDPLLMIATIEILLQDVFQSLRCLRKVIQDDRQDFLTLVPLKWTNYMRSISSRRHNILELSHILSHTRMELHTMRRSMKYFGTNSGPKYVIDRLKDKTTREENNAAQSIVELDSIACQLRTNAGKFTKRVKFLIRGSCTASISLWIALSYFVHDQSKVTRYTTIALRASAVVGVIIEVLLFVFGEKYFFNLKEVEEV